MPHHPTLEAWSYHWPIRYQRRWWRSIRRWYRPLGGHWRERCKGKGHLWLSCDISPLLLLQHILLCQLLSGLPPLVFLFTPRQQCFLYASTILQWWGDWSAILMCFCRSAITSVPSFNSSSASSMTFLSFSPAGVSSFLAAALM